VRIFLSLLNELLWLGGAAAFAWYFLGIFLGIEAVAAVTTLILYRVELRWR